MSNYYQNKNPTTSDPHPLPAQLRKALENTGRGKYSSATPTPPQILSPRPNRAFQTKIDTMNKSSETFNRSSGNPNPAMNIPRGSAAVTFHLPQSKNIVGGAAPTDSQIAAFNRSAAEFRDRLENILKRIRNNNGITANMQTFLTSEVEAVGEEFHHQFRQLQEAYDRALAEKNSALSQLDKVRQDFEAASSARDRSQNECRNKQRIIDDLKLKARKSKERLEQLQAQWRDVNDGLLKRLRVQDEQLQGKRALWLESHPGSSARRDAMNAIGDPFNSPTTNSTHGYDSSGNLGGLGSPNKSSNRQSFSAMSSGAMVSFAQPSLSAGRQNSFPLQPAPSHGSMRRRPNLQPNRPLPAIDYQPACDIGQRKIYNTEPGSRGEDDRGSKALVRYRPDLDGLNDDEISSLFKAEFSKFFSLAEGWVRIYCSEPNMANDQKIARSNQSLWAFMMNCTYPGNEQAAHSHVVTLIKDRNSRYWFCMRMICGYLMKEVLRIEAFEKFSPKSEREILEVKQSLQERGLANEARQKLIDKQVSIVSEVIQAADYREYNSVALGFHSKRLRDMLGPILNDDADRKQAGRDLGHVASTAWKLSENMWTSHLTFQVYFPETAAKFSAATMIAKDSKLEPMQLQIKQARLKLVISPVVTLRDDRGTTIKVKSLHHATVLTMG